MYLIICRQAKAHSGARLDSDLEDMRRNSREDWFELSHSRHHHSPPEIPS